MSPRSIQFPVRRHGDALIATSGRRRSPVIPFDNPVMKRVTSAVYLPKLIFPPGRISNIDGSLLEESSPISSSA